MFRFYSNIYGIKNQRVVFLIAGWETNINQYFLPSKLLEWSGYQVHTYAYDKNILSSDPSQTIKDFMEIKEDILKKVEQLKSKGHDSFYIFGTSLGSFLAILIANTSPDISKVVLNLTGADMAEIFWQLKKGFFKEELLNKNITLDKLRKDWKKITPENNINKLKGKKLLVFLDKNDEYIPYHYGKELVNQFKDLGINFQVAIDKHGKHLFAAVLNLLNFKKYVYFFNN